MRGSAEEGSPTPQEADQNMLEEKKDCNSLKRTWKITQADSWAHLMGFWRSDCTSLFELLKMKAEF